MTEHLYNDNSDLISLLYFTYNFVSLKAGFLCYNKPTCSRCILYILYGHPSGTHFLILNLKLLRDSDSFI